MAEALSINWLIFPHFLWTFLPSMAVQGSERPGAVKGVPVLGAAQRTLDGEDRSETIVAEGKATRFTHDNGCFHPQLLLQNQKVQGLKQRVTEE
jgi:hypothetical protein